MAKPEAIVLLRPELWACGVRGQPAKRRLYTRATTRHHIHLFRLKARFSRPFERRVSYQRPSAQLKSPTHMHRPASPACSPLPSSPACSPLPSSVSIPHAIAAIAWVIDTLGGRQGCGTQRDSRWSNPAIDDPPKLSPHQVLALSFGAKVRVNAASSESIPGNVVRQSPRTRQLWE